MSPPRVNLTIDDLNMKHGVPTHAGGPARILRELLRRGLDTEAIPHALKLIAALEELAEEDREEVAA